MGQVADMWTAQGVDPALELADELADVHLEGPGVVGCWDSGVAHRLTRRT